MTSAMNTSPVYCQFCGDSNTQVTVMFVSGDAAICSECVSFCMPEVEKARLRRSWFDEFGEHFAQEISG